MSFKVKFNYNGIFRRTSLEALSHESVEKAAREVFDIPDHHKVTLTWVDEEGDVVYVSSQQEFKEFMKVQSELNRPVGYGAGQQLPLYKFGLVTEDVRPPAAEAAPVENPGASAKAPEGSAVHRGVMCDACGVGPIIGIRYKCTGRDDYDLCSECEARTEQPFPMLKMYEPKIGVRLNVRGVGFGQ